VPGVGEVQEVVVGDVQAGELGQQLGAAARSQRLRGDLAVELGGAAGEALGGVPGPEPAAVGAGDDAVVAAAAPVPALPPEQGDHLGLGQ
jgi:hypothetical protein